MQYITPESAQQPFKPSPKKSSPRKEEQPIKKKQKPPTPEEPEDTEEIEKTVLGVIKEMEGEEGAPWDIIVENCKKEGLDENTIEESLTSLMDKGFIFEPVLGTIKTT